MKEEAPSSDRYKVGESYSSETKGSEAVFRVSKKVTLLKNAVKAFSTPNRADLLRAEVFGIRHSEDNQDDLELSAKSPEAEVRALGSSVDDRGMTEENPPPENDQRDPAFLDLGDGLNLQVDPNPSPSNNIKPSSEESDQEDFVRDLSASVIRLCITNLGQVQSCIEVTPLPVSTKTDSFDSDFANQAGRAGVHNLGRGGVVLDMGIEDFLGSESEL